MKKRCPWVDPEDPLSCEYHDREWGVPLHDDRKLFEFLALEGAQAGLNWMTILRKRENYRRAFDDFDPAKVARYDERKVERLLSNAGIVRNRLKIECAIANAKAYIEVRKECGSFDAYIWRFVDGKPIQNRWKRSRDTPAITPEARVMSADLSNRGFKFVGPTICYAYMQATGMVNDHLVDCHRHATCAAPRKRA